MHHNCMCLHANRPDVNWSDCKCKVLHVCAHNVPCAVHDSGLYQNSGAGSDMAGMAAPYQSAEIRAVDFQKNY